MAESSKTFPKGTAAEDFLLLFSNSSNPTPDSRSFISYGTSFKKKSTEIWEKICRVNNKGSVIGTSEKPIVRNIYAINEQVLIL